MEIKVDKGAIQAMITEILLKDKELSRDIFNVLIKENPQFLEDFLPASTMVVEPKVLYRKVKPEAVSEKTEISDVEIRILANRQFEKYDDVFKALA